MSGGDGERRLRVHSVTWEAEGIHSYELRDPEGGELAPFTAGAHIDLHLPSGVVRSYSLVNPQGERRRYVIAVQRDRASRGGSTWVHDNLRVGAMIPVASPRNNFPLAEDGAHSLFIAGGIGITPLWCMMQRLAALGRPFELYDCVRTRKEAAFREPIAALAEKAGAKLVFNFDGEPGGKMLDIAAVVGQADAQAHLYCCGPLPMLAAFEEATKDRPREHVHVEYFTPKEAPAAEGGFTVVLAKTGRSFTIAPGKTILETLLDAGLDVASSCLEGVCGTCETKVLEGIPDHRDVVLTESERKANKTMMICCSGSKTERLVLDL
ncbi:MAG TPA: PDR/VanB family oxidoreductase [Stellaceae bacterium]|nr:PDR/VanB family oxidoreductase [Stellaceae bacterium]